jgi:hypothetical protein
MGNDVGALNALMGILNNPAITGAAVPKPGDDEDGSGATQLPADPAVAASRAPKVTTPAPAPRRKITGLKFAFTGRIKSGKDYVAAALNAKIFGFAEPLYALQDHFFGTHAVTDPKQKDIPGARQFLQTVGQWGWGAVNEKYQLTPARAAFITMIRSLGAAGVFPAHLQVDWESFGKDKEIWVRAALRRIDEFMAAHPGQRIAIVNARFEHEFTPLKQAGFEHYHVMCSSKTWAERIAKAGLTEKSPAVLDMSEKLAHALDQSVIKQISAQKSGPMLKAIWNDSTVQSPSNRLYTLQNFLQEAAVSEVPDNYASAE